jgi:methylglutaconyl-CoA hydratase
MTEPTIEIERKGAIASVWLNRTEVHNALNEMMIDEITEAFHTLSAQDSVRVIVLSGRGKSFSAGADIESMKRQGAAPITANLENARQLAEMFRTIAESPKPTVARINGAAIGGGLGLVAACDIAIASSTAIFAASEVRLGLIPSTIAPYVVRAIGERQARRLFQTAERISAAQAQAIGLVHDVAALDQLDTALKSILDNLLAGAPNAQHAAKNLIDAVAHQPITLDLIENTAVRIATIRSEPEAREGLSAFLEKRPANWVPHE